MEKENIKSEMFRAYMGFNTDYFKMGQLIKVTVRDLSGMLIRKEYGFVKYFDRDCLVFIHIDKNGEEQQETIVPADLTQNEMNIKIEIEE